MNCRDVRSHFADLLYDELPESKQATVHAHLAECSACREEWDGIRQGQAFLNRLSDESARSAIDATRVLRLRTARLERSRRHWRWATAGLALIAAVLLAAVGLRIEVSRGQLVLSWTSSASTSSVPIAETDRPDRLAEFQSALEEQKQQLASLNELLQLTAREVLAVDGRYVADLTRLRQDIAEMQRQQDARWKLLASELLSRDAELTAMNAPPAH